MHATTMQHRMLCAEHLLDSKWHHRLLLSRLPRCTRRGHVATTTVCRSNEASSSIAPHLSAIVVRKDATLPAPHCFKIAQKARLEEASRGEPETAAASAARRWQQDHSTATVGQFLTVSLWRDFSANLNLLGRRVSANRGHGEPISI
jgi:hypothetical protein